MPSMFPIGRDFDIQESVYDDLKSEDLKFERILERQTLCKHLKTAINGGFYDYTFCVDCEKRLSD